MDCDKLNLNINSGCNRSVGGIKKVWLMTKPLTDLQWNEKERLLITDYNLQNLPVEISPNERTSTFDMSVDNNQNVITYVNRLVINFPLIESEKKHGLDKMLSNDIYVIFLDSNNQYFYMTPDFGGRCTNLIGETGSKGGSNYYSLEFVSNSRRHIPEIFGFSVDCSITFGPNSFFPTSFRSEVTFSDDIPLPVNIDLFYEGNNFIKTFVANTNPYEVFYVKGTFGAPVSATSYTLVVSGLTSCPDTTKVLYPTLDPIRDDKTTSEFFVIGNNTTLQVEATDNFSGIKNSFVNIDGLQFPLYTKESYELIGDTSFISGTSSNKFYTLKDDFSTSSFLTGLTEQMSDLRRTPYDTTQTSLDTPISNREQVRFKLQTPIKDGYGPFILSNTSMGYENQNTNHNNLNFPNPHNWATNIKLYSLDGYYSEVTDGVGNSINGTISNEDIENNGLVLYNIEDYTENVSIDNIGVEFGYLSPYTTATTFNYQTKPTINSVFDIVNTLEPFNYLVTNFSSEHEKDLYYFWYNNDDFLPTTLTVTLSGSSGQETYTYNHLNTTSTKQRFEDTHFYTEFLRSIGITVHTLYVSEFDVSGNPDVRFNLYCSIDKDTEIVSITEFIKDSKKEVYRNKLSSNPNPLYRITWSGVPTTDFGIITYDADDYSEGINLYEYTQFGTGYTVDYNNGTDVMTITENAANDGVKFTTYTSLGECLTNNQTFNSTLTITGFSNTLKAGKTLSDVDYYYLNVDSYLLYGDANPIDLTSNYNHNVPVLTNEYKLGLWGLPHDYYYVGSITNQTPTLYGNHSAISGNCQSLNFDGVAEYIDCSNNSVFDFGRTDAFSFETWVKFDSLTGFNFLHSKVEFGGTPVARGYYLGTENNKLKFLFFHTNTNLISVDTVQTLSTGVWYHVVMTYDGSSNSNGVKFYLDDTLLTNNIITNSLTLDPTTNTLPFQLGGQGSSFLEGNIAKARVWNTELTSGEVTTLYNGGCINYSPIQTGSLILDVDITNASWNGSEYDITDLSSTNATCQTVDMEITDLETDCPC